MYVRNERRGDSFVPMRLSIDRASHRAALAAIVLVLCAIPWTPARIVGVLFAAGVLPGLGPAMHPRMTADAALGIGAALSPVIFGAATTLAVFAGASIHGAAWIATALSLVLFVAWAGRSPALSSDDRRSLAGAAIVFFAAAVLSLSLPLADAWWRMRDDSWFHAAVADKLARDGLPLTDPYFAGLRLQYMYVYHALVAACASLAGVDHFQAMILVNAMALASTVFSFFALAGQFTRRMGPRLLGTCVWIFAMNGWFYLSYPIRLVRALVGETRGLETLQHMFRSTPPGHATAMSLLSVEGNQFMFLDKFMIGTAFSLTFGLAASFLFLLVRARRGEWSRRHVAAFVLCVAGALLLHIVTGSTLAVVTAAVLAFLLVVRAQPAPGGPSYARLIAWITLGFALAAPYLYSVMPRGGGEASAGFALQRSQTIGLWFDILPALFFAMVFLRSASRDTPETLGARPFAEMSLSATGILLMWAVVTTVVALTVDLATNNETKFAFLVMLPIAALAVGGLDRWWTSPRKRWAAVLVVASATLPLHAVYFCNAVRDASTLSVSGPERAAYDWLAKSAPRDAVVIEENDIVRVPVLASRDLYWGTEGYARGWGYPHDEMAARKRIRGAVFSERGPSDVDLKHVRALGRPVFVIYRLHEGDMIDAPERFEYDRRFRGRFATREIAVWEILPGE